MKNIPLVISDPFMVTPIGTSSVPPVARPQDWVLSLGNFDGDIDELKISR
jgi:hypothetical protein